MQLAATGTPRRAFAGASAARGARRAGRRLVAARGGSRLTPRHRRTVLVRIARPERALVARGGGLFHGATGGLFRLLARALGGGFLFGALPCKLIATLLVRTFQRGVLGFVAGLGFGQLALRLLALLVQRRLDLGALDVGALLPHLDVHRGLALAGGDGDLFHLATFERDLARRGVGRSGFAATVGAAQEAKQLDLLGRRHDLIGAAEAHAGLRQLLQQLVDRGADQRGKGSYGDVRHAASYLFDPPETRADS